ncbi:MAG TPA: glycosyltransferase family 2 protein [Methylomirabilota bacterium]|jgi:hypothetical protein|nr:glycosyltransferase family 2 protein [Methylomirabilota bacterium]
MNPWIVIPAFNEAATVGRVVSAARRYGPVLVIDDGSTDGTAAIALAAGGEVIRHRRRLGKGQALRTGMVMARQRGATHVVTLDGDGQHAPGDLPAVLAAARESPRAIIIGSRVGSDGEAGDVVPAGRLNAIRVAGFFVDWAGGLRLRDTQSGFRVYPVAGLDELQPRRGGFVFETEVLIAAAARSIAIREVAITVIARAARRSRFRPIGDGLAISAYLAGRVLKRWVTETRAALGEVAALCSPARRRVRHAAMLEAGAAYGDSFASWGVALTAEAVRRVSARLAGWWRHPRRRRAAVAARATLALPLLLVLAMAQALAGRLLPDLVTPLVRRLYSQDRLDALIHTSEVAPESRTPVTTHGLS